MLGLRRSEECWHSFLGHIVILDSVIIVCRSHIHQGGYVSNALNFGIMPNYPGCGIDILKWSYVHDSAEFVRAYIREGMLKADNSREMGVNGSMA